MAISITNSAVSYIILASIPVGAFTNTNDIPPEDDKKFIVFSLLILLSIVIIVAVNN